MAEPRRTAPTLPPDHHALKTWQPFFDDVLAERKTFEIRQDDGRNFKVGDALILCEWDVGEADYTGRFVVRRVTYLFRGDGWLGVESGTVVMGIVPSSISFPFTPEFQHD